MKVLHISAASELAGAGKATILTHDALLASGVESKILFLKSELVGPGIYSYHRKSFVHKLIRFFVTQLDQFPLLFYFKKSKRIFSPALTGLNLKRNNLIIWADVIHIHWANHGFIDISEINKWDKPIIFTLRDMWAFTGGCHYAFECMNFKNECGKCPSLGSDKEKDLSTLVLKRKLKYLSSANINWIAISSWMQKKAKESIILKNKEIPIIYSGVDTTKFKILNKIETRNKLNLPIDKTILLIGATDLRERFKGFEHAKILLNKVNKDYLVITFGFGHFKKNEIPQQVIHYGNIKTSILCELYNAVDVFIGPSIAEGMGKTFLESQLCGTPVLCFDETGPVDIVSHKKTGYLAKFKDDGNLYEGLLFCLNTKMNREFIRSKSVNKFSINVIVKQYIKTYEKSIMDWSDCSSI